VFYLRSKVAAISVTESVLFSNNRRASQLQVDCTNVYNTVVKLTNLYMSSYVN
jgi:hypothetical protein